MAFIDRVVEHPNRVQLIPVASSTYSFTADGYREPIDLGVDSPTITSVTVNGTPETGYTLDGSIFMWNTDTTPYDGDQVEITFTASGLYDLQRAEGFVTEVGTPLKAEELTDNVRELIDASTEGIEIQNDGDVYFQNLQRGYALIQGTANAVASLNVTFATPFTSVPRVCCTPHTSRPDLVQTSVGNITRNGFTLYLYRTSAASTGVSWIATI